MPKNRGKPESELKEYRYDVTDILPEHIHSTGDPTETESKKDYAEKIIKKLQPVYIGTEPVEYKHDTYKQEQYDMIYQRRHQFYYGKNSQSEVHFFHKK